MFSFHLTENKLTISLLRPTGGHKKTAGEFINAFFKLCVITARTSYPRVAASSPKGRHFSIIKRVFLLAHVHSITAAQIYETLLFAAANLDDAL